MSESEGISGYGTTLEGATSGAIGHITKIGLPGQEAMEIDISTMSSPDTWREFIAGFKDAKEIQVELLYEPVNMDVILAAVGEANEEWTITFPDTAAFVGNGFVKSLGTQVPMDDKISQSMVIRLSGKPEFYQASA